MFSFVFWVFFVIAVTFFWYFKLATRKLSGTLRGGAREIEMVYRPKLLFRGFILSSAQLRAAVVHHGLW